MIVSEQLNYIKTRRFHAIFMPVLIEFSRCIGTYSSAKFEYIIKAMQEYYKLLEILGKQNLVQSQDPHFKWGFDFYPSGVFPGFRLRRGLATPFLLVAF